MTGVITSISVFAFLVWLILRQNGRSRSRSSWSDRFSGAEATAQRGEETVRTTNKRNQARHALKQLREKEKLSNSKVSAVGRIGEMITCAGYSFSPRAYLLTTAVLGALIFCFLILTMGMGLLPGFLIAAMTGFFGPRWWLQYVIAKRRKKFLAQLADALDMVVRGAKAGLPLVECLRAVAQESEDPLASEFRTLVDKLALGADLKLSLNGMYQRMPIPEASFFAVVLVIQNQSGGNLSEALSNLSTVIRARAMMKEKVKALTSESTASSFVLGGLPFLVTGLIYFVQPDYITPLFGSSLGQNLLFCAAGLMACGILVMRRLSALKV